MLHNRPLILQILTKELKSVEDNITTLDRQIANLGTTNLVLSTRKVETVKTLKYERRELKLSIKSIKEYQ